MNWEYKTVGLNSSKEDHLNELGAQGWELMFIDQGVAYLKRLKGIPVGSSRGDSTAVVHPTRERLKKS